VSPTKGWARRIWRPNRAHHQDPGPNLAASGGVGVVSKARAASNARRALPRSTPGSAITCPTRVEDPVRCCRRGQPAPPVRERRRGNPSSVNARRHATLHRRSQRNASIASRSDKLPAGSAARSPTRPHPRARSAARSPKEQVGEHVVREQHPAIIGENAYS
jgi:hypothetical protein